MVVRDRLAELQRKSAEHNSNGKSVTAPFIPSSTDVVIQINGDGSGSARAPRSASSKGGKGGRPVSSLDTFYEEIELVKDSVAEMKDLIQRV